MLEDGNTRVEDFEENVNYSGKICKRCGAKYIDVLKADIQFCVQSAEKIR